MKLKSSLKIIFIFIIVSLCIFFKENIHAMTQEEAGQYISQFAINFADNYTDQAVYSYNDAHRFLAYNGIKTSGRIRSNWSHNGTSFTDKYAMDCVGWVSFVIHQSLGINSNIVSNYGAYRFSFFVVPTSCSGTDLSVMERVPVDQIMPGDILVQSGHVMVYVGNNTIVDSIDPANLPYIAKRNVPKFVAAYRIRADIAANIDSANATTIFNGQGGISSNWIDGIGSVSGSQGTTVNRIVSPDDKLPLYKHILLTEKYNFNGIKWEKYGHGYAGSPCEMTSDTSLGIKYPQDENNTNLNDFINFVFPYLQNWLVPLSMHSGLVNNSNYDANSAKSPNFAYSIIKDAMSDITVNRYDISTCELKTRFQEYDVVTFEKISTPAYDNNGKLVGYSVTQEWTEKDRDHVNTRLDSSGNISPMLEEYVSENRTITPEYYIKDALMFDVKISNIFNYIQYSDFDVENRIENGTGFVSSIINVGEAINSDQYGSTSTTDSQGRIHETYKVNVGNIKYVTRTWQDTLEQTGQSSVEDYTYNDVKEYNNVYGDLSLSNISDAQAKLDQKIRDKIPTGDSTLESIRWLFPYALIAAYQTNGKILPSVLVAQAVQEGGFTNIAAAKKKLDDTKATSLTMDRNKSLFNQKTIPGYIGSYPSIETTGTIVQIEAYANKLATDTTLQAYKDAREIASTEITSGSELDYQERIQSVLHELGAAYLEDTEISKETYKSTVYNIVATYELYKLDMLYDELKNDTSINLNDVKKANEENQKNKFDSADDNYYNFLIASDSKINRIDIINSKSDNYLKYMKKGENRANHVGFSRAYLTLSYDELKRLFKEYFSSGTLPFFWGSSLGYNTYTKVNDLKTSSYSSQSSSILSNFGDLTGTSIELGTEIDSQSYKNAMKYFDIVSKWANKFGLDPYLVIAIIAQESGGNIDAELDAIGLMQYEESNGTTFNATYGDGTCEEITFTLDELRSSADLQIKVGCAVLKNNIDYFNGNLLMGLQACEFGPSGVKRTVTHYITDGISRDEKDKEYFGVTDAEFNDYVYSKDNGWVKSTQWYYEEEKVGDPDYLKNVLRYYNSEELQQNSLPNFGSVSEAVKAMVEKAISMKSSILYRQTNRQTASTLEKLDAIKQTDCSAYVSSLYKVFLNIDVGSTSAIIIENARKANTSNGYKAIYGAVNVNDLSNLQMGDILWRSGHVALYCGNGMVISQGGPGGINSEANPSWRGPSYTAIGKSSKPYTNYIRYVKE